MLLAGLIKADHPSANEESEPTPAASDAEDCAKGLIGILLDVEQRRVGRDNLKE
jgi:hypothetical protein